MREQNMLKAKARWLIKDVKENRVPWRQYYGTRNETYALTQIRILQYMCQFHRGPTVMRHHYRALYLPFYHAIESEPMDTAQHITSFITKNLEMFQEIDTLPPGSINRRVGDLKDDALDV